MPRGRSSGIASTRPSTASLEVMTPGLPDPGNKAAGDWTCMAVRSLTVGAEFMSICRAVKGRVMGME